MMSRVVVVSAELTAKNLRAATSGAAGGVAGGGGGGGEGGGGRLLPQHHHGAAVLADTSGLTSVLLTDGSRPGSVCSARDGGSGC